MCGLHMKSLCIYRNSKVKEGPPDLDDTTSTSFNHAYGNYLVELNIGKPP